VTQYVKGLQGDHPRYVRANAGCKSFAVYSGPEDIPSSRFSFDARVNRTPFYSSDMILCGKNLKTSYCKISSLRCIINKLSNKLCIVIVIEIAPSSSGVEILVVYENIC